MLRIKAHAKINLSLKILGKRPDGFHEIESLMQSVSLCDLLTLTPIPSGIQLATTNLRLPADGRNLAYRAAEVFYRAVSHKPSAVSGIKIYLEKNIPLAAGLAGGSANAAAVFYGLNKLSGNPLSQNDLMKLGEEIGSDVPFCLVGGSCTVKGRGERVSRNPLPITRYYVLVVPEIEISTKWAYDTWDEENSKVKMQKSKNDFEPIVAKKYPIIKKIKDRLLELGCSYAQMSGSGPGVFGVTNDASAAEKIAVEMKNDHPRSFFVHSVGAGVEVE